MNKKIILETIAVVLIFVLAGIVIAIYTSKSRPPTNPQTSEVLTQEELTALQMRNNTGSTLTENEVEGLKQRTTGNASSYETTDLSRLQQRTSPEK